MAGEKAGSSPDSLVGRELVPQFSSSLAGRFHPVLKSQQEAVRRMPWVMRYSSGRDIFPVLLDNVRGLLANHDGGCIGVARHEVWHDGGVHHAEVFDTDHPELWVDDGA